MFWTWRWDHLNRRLDRLEVLLRLTLNQEKIMSKAIDDLVAAVAAEKDVEMSAIALLQGLSKKLDDAIAGNDMAAVSKAAADIKANTAALAAAVTANTPAEDVPVQTDPAPEVMPVADPAADVAPEAQPAQ